MKNTYLKSVLVALGILMSASSLMAQIYSESEIQDIYMSFLEDEEIEGFVDSDGDVQFEYHGRKYYIEVDEDNPNYLSIVLWDFWPIESTSEAVQIAIACDVVNRETKVVKAFSENDNVVLACELFVESPRDMASVFSLCIASIEAAVDIFVDEM
ncbi:hypothetical protein [Phaeocystidibacter luteus]|uniref:YbjN domain-containing protein n=1 Tax=Phaeocystidibacter luteus TaxID=911197 RepID=A0A6N6RJD2_9FLAO|nr:hypothetical protein [Phaeocystidibacter luteus]KAB2813738.1 hypothetical protein F8C67_06150 [Phaeocystidibacter luteus]